MLILRNPRTAFGYPANDRINLAVLGHLYNAGHFFSSIHAYPNVDLVALCNPDERKHAEAYKIWEQQAKKWAGSAKPEERTAAEQFQRLSENKPPAYADFRRMFDELADRIDAIVVSLFDHYHGPACGTAMRLGKHVFSERPLGLTIGEARSLRALASETKVATSIRNPGNASAQFRRGLELIRDGVLGAIEEVHVWFDRGGPERNLPAGAGQPPRGSPPVPEGLHWDLWLGPAAERPYHPDWMAYAHWRDFSNGGIGTFGPHAANLAFMALRVQDLWQLAGDDAAQRTLPAAEFTRRGGQAGNQTTLRVEADCSLRTDLSFPRWETVRWQIPARGELPPIRFTWHHGPGLSPGAKSMLLKKMAEHGATEEVAQKLLGYAGALLIGKEGLLATDDHNVKFTLLPEAKFRDIEQHRPKSVAASHGHYNDWLRHCRGGEPAWANFQYAGPLSEFLMLGNLATRFQGELEYDPVAGKIRNHADANRALNYEYRPGWKL